jgi:hypothetical protein
MRYGSVINHFNAHVSLCRILLDQYPQSDFMAHLHGNRVLDFADRRIRRWSSMTNQIIKALQN